MALIEMPVAQLDAHLLEMLFQQATSFRVGFEIAGGILNVDLVADQRLVKDIIRLPLENLSGGGDLRRRRPHPSHSGPARTWRVCHTACHTAAAKRGISAFVAGLCWRATREAAKNSNRVADLQSFRNAVVFMPEMSKVRRHFLQAVLSSSRTM